MLVTLPSVQNGDAAGAIFAFVVSFGEVNATLFLLGPGLATLPIHVFSQIQFGAEQVVVAASTVQIALVIALIFVLEKIGLSKRSDWRSLRDSLVKPRFALSCCQRRSHDVRRPACHDRRKSRFLYAV